MAFFIPMRRAAAETPSQDNGFKSGELLAMEALASSFMTRHLVPALSVAITKDGRLVYAQAFGMADKSKNEHVTPNHLFRIASVSKPITAVAILRLIESGKLRLGDKVFGAGSVLGTTYGKQPYAQHIEDITIEHLLTHTAGGWKNDGGDPMFAHTSMDHHELIAWTLDHQPPAHAPGSQYAYSNFGYCILGRVIEKLTGKPYAAAVQDEVLKPCGVSGMRIAGNTMADRAANEVIYYDQNRGNPYGMNVRRMDAHGGWLATPADLVRFAVRVDGFPTKPDILKPGTIAEMSVAPAISPGYAKGWAVNKHNNWWHAGSLPGTNTILVRTHHQFCWAALTNTRNHTSNLSSDLDQLMWKMIGKITRWPAIDLFA